MTTQRILIICCGTVAMLIQMLLRRKNYPCVSTWKIPILSVLLTVAGVAGAMLMFFIESGHFGGTSFFGAILFVPVLLLPALLLRVPFGTLMDLSACAECAMLAVMKIDCLVCNCCIGRYLPALEFQFPSQIVEMVTILVIMVFLLRMERNPRHRNAIYGYYLVFYGITRFILNWFRYGLTPFVWILPAGNFWSIVAIFAGVIWIFAARKLRDRKRG